MPDSTLGKPLIKLDYPDWRRSVEQRLEKGYCVTITDVGFDEAYLVKHWEEDEPPFEFVEWLATKYDLDKI